MKPWKSWLACLGMAGACLAFVGCGKGDVPDPDSDPNAAKEQAPEAGSAQPVAQEAAGDKNEQAAAATASKDEEAATEGASTKAAGEGKHSSATSEMLALAGGTAADPDAAAPAAGAAAGASPAPGQGQAQMAPPSNTMGPGYPGAGGNASQQAAMMKGAGIMAPGGAGQMAAMQKGMQQGGAGWGFHR